MARATTSASGKAGAKKPAVPRKAAAVVGAATDLQETGAKAPVSLPAEPAATGDAPTPQTSKAVDAAPGADSPAVPQEGKVLIIGAGAPFFPGMGRFPADWQPLVRLVQPAPESPESEQTSELEALGEALQFPVWGLPDIAEFPALLQMVNNTRNILVVRPLSTRLMQFGKGSALCATAEQYDAIKRELSARAVRERWDSDTGLQVTHVNANADQD